MERSGSRALVAVVLLAGVPSMAAGQDLIANGHFDTDVNGWTIVIGQGATQVWDPLDWQSNPASGSMLLTSAGAPLTASGQCIPLSPSGTYEVGGHLRFPSGQPAFGSATIIVGWYTNQTCNGQPASSVNSGLVPSTLTDVWVESFGPSVTAPAGTLSAGVGPAIINNGGGSLAAHFDRVRFGPSGTTPVQVQSFTVE